MFGMKAFTILLLNIETRQKLKIKAHTTLMFEIQDYTMLCLICNFIQTK
jgi:hypothetical protein